ncbi:unnamed protein product [Darwinula stevensoni]|uniref:Uncharacterized protein n=1 Tax=Darwinula stevensoni TaxID=69355 RepID=A0A7R8XAZ0_9CRUS|nr:unnamed protein product [Darwinula stevensoni]CAG0885959.1 unnamed protein product [Darwinula stevensoni]
MAAFFGAITMKSMVDFNLACARFERPRQVARSRRMIFGTWISVQLRNLQLAPSHTQIPFSNFGFKGLIWLLEFLMDFIFGRRISHPWSHLAY